MSSTHLQGQQKKVTGTKKNERKTKSYVTKEKFLSR